MPVITFDGDNKHINATFGPSETVVTTDIENEIYDVWKDWVVTGDNSKLGALFFPSGGDDYGNGEFSGIGLLLADDWCIRPVSDHDIYWTLRGNLFPSDPNDLLFCRTGMTGGAQAFVERRTSTLPTIREVGTGTLSSEQQAQLAQAANLTVALDGTFTAADILRIAAAVLAGKTSGQPTAPIYRNLSDTANTVTGVVDANGNRTSVTVSL